MHLLVVNTITRDFMSHFKKETRSINSRSTNYNMKFLEHIIIRDPDDYHEDELYYTRVIPNEFYIRYQDKIIAMISKERKQTEQYLVLQCGKYWDLDTVVKYIKGKCYAMVVDCSTNEIIEMKLASEL